MNFLTFTCPFGTFTIVWKGTEPDLHLQRIFLSDSSQNSEIKAKSAFKNIKSGLSSSISGLGDKIQLFLGGEDIKFDLEPLDFTLCSETQEKVLKAEYEIPRGRVSTYKRIANHISIQNGARVVGNALAKNPFPIIIPCHRVIKSDGKIGGYQGGIAMKRKLLQMEGIKFCNKGKVIIERIFY